MTSTRIEQYREFAAWTRFVLDQVFHESFVPDTDERQYLLRYAQELLDLCNQQFAAVLGLEVCDGLPCLLEITDDLRPCHNLMGDDHCEGCTDKDYLTGWRERYVTLYRKSAAHPPSVLVVEFTDELDERLKDQAKRDAAELGLEVFFPARVKAATGYNMLPSDDPPCAQTQARARDTLVAEAGFYPGKMHSMVFVNS